jgi:hypothetical protein
MQRSRSMLLIQYWDTEDIPTYIAELFRSFRTHNPGLNHRIFGRASAEDFIAENFTSREVAAFRACAVPSMQADYFRYCAVLTMGGVYADADFRCVGSLKRINNGSEDGTLFVKPNGNIPCSFFAFQSPGHNFLKLALEIATVRIEERDPKDDAWLATGPAITTYMYHLFRAGSIDVFLKQFSGDDYVRNYPEFLANVVSGYSRIEQAFNGILVLPFAEAKTWVRPVQPPYKETSVHWTRWQGGIFRDDARRWPGRADVWRR